MQLNPFLTGHEPKREAEREYPIYDVEYQSNNSNDQKTIDISIKLFCIILDDIYGKNTKVIIHL